ncbi:MAG TPA: hypothetical protein PKC35_02620, partial [Leptospiraceae bacterium]|nr:hypothetical protein [Leptospiraceae bacterium]
SLDALSAIVHRTFLNAQVKQEREMSEGLTENLRYYSGSPSSILNNPSLSLSNCEEAACV